MEDADAWLVYPEHRYLYNKLELSMRLGYDCGPGGVPPTRTDYYCVRPIYNLLGMGVGARRQLIEAGDHSGVEPGYFWCEWFSGNQYSVTVSDGCQMAYRAERDIANLSRFKSWSRVDRVFEIPDWLPNIPLNIEFIEDRIIEVHLRTSPDPNYDELIPVWLGEPTSRPGYQFIESYDSALDYLNTPRIGFLVKNREF